MKIGKVALEPNIKDSGVQMVYLMNMTFSKYPQNLYLISELSLRSICSVSDLRTFESIATEHIICADKLVLVPNFYCSLATVCYILTKSLISRSTEF